MKRIRAKQLRGKSIAIIGLGQIGGSILRRLSPLRPAITLIAHDRDRCLAASVHRHARWVTSFDQAIAEADIVVLSVPVPGILALIDQVGALAAKSKGREKLLVLDTGTLKLPVVNSAKLFRRQFDFVGLHPLAGHEGEGWGSSNPHLFEKRVIVYTKPPSHRRPSVLELINLLGGMPLPMAAKEHDDLVAESIGLPHMLGYAAQGIANDNPLRVASWSSLTRVAASNPEMVGGFLTANRDALRRALRRFDRELHKLLSALDDPSGRALVRELSRRRRRES